MAIMALTLSLIHIWFKEENPLINQLQVSSQDDPPAPTMNRTEIPYEGVTKEIIVIPEESDPFSVKVKAIVEVAPVLSRFEIIPGEIVVTNPATTCLLYTSS